MDFYLRDFKFFDNLFEQVPNRVSAIVLSLFVAAASSMSSLELISCRCDVTIFYSDYDITVG